MRTKYSVCSKFWSDINITYAKKNIRHCCKTDRDKETSIEEIRELKGRVFDFGSDTREAKKDMVERDVLPFLCRDCAAHDPDSIRHVWNVWTDEYIDYLRPSLVDHAMFTNYIEFDIGNQCDLACVYCGPWSSTTWAKELRYLKQPEVDNKDWIEAVIEAMVDYLKMLPPENHITFNILGGEPTLMPETFDIIERMKDATTHFTTKPRFMITTNLNTKHKLFERFLSIVEETKDNFDWCIGVSIEDVRERAEATRYHLEWDRFESNLKEIAGKVHYVYLTTTISAMSIDRFDDFMKWSFDVLGHENYRKTWSYSLNSVQNNYADIAYLYADLIDMDRIITAYKNLANVETDDMVEFLHILTNRIGTKKPNDDYYKFWSSFRERRNIDYTVMFPAIGETIVRSMDE